MDIRELKYFLAVSQAESISKAAQMLYITQPNLSRQMQNLEKEIGQILFVRGTRKLTLTEAGKLLQKRAQEIVELFDKTQSEFVTDSQQIKGTISIGGGESYAVELVAQAAQEIQQSHNGIKFSLYSGDTIEVMEKLDKGLLDFGILIEPKDITQYDTIKLPLTDIWGVLMPKDCQLAQNKVITKDMLTNLPLILSKHSYNDNIISKWFGEYQSQNIVATYNLLYNASLLVEAGMGYALCIDKIINVSGDSQLCFRPLHPMMQTNLYIAWKKNSVMSQPAKLFLQQIKQYC